MTITVILEWNFSPPNYFEEPIEISRENYTMKIEPGEVIATIDYAVFNKNPSLQIELYESLNNRFLAAQLLSHQMYELFSSRMTHIDRDGHKHIFVGLSSASMLVTTGHLDFLHTDKDGNVISDSRRDRIENKINLAELVAKHKPNDQLVAALLQSHSAAVTDPNNELVHLYEIRDAISNKFGNENSARQKLGITKSQWSRFGALCNTLPLKQGRHRGDFAGELRDASESELEEVRKISQAMIEAYLQYLENLNI